MVLDPLSVPSQVCGQLLSTGLINDSINETSAGLPRGFSIFQGHKGRRCFEMPSNKRQSRNSELFGIERIWEGC
jgi:hypothetical protein